LKEAIATHIVILYCECPRTKYDRLNNYYNFCAD
jgi:hypothetical protein